MEAVAVALRGATASVLADCEVHVDDQIGLEATAGSVVIVNPETAQSHIAIGEQLEDAVQLEIIGTLAFADTQASRQNIKTLCRGIVNILRDNRRISAGGELARTNAQEPLRWRCGFVGEGDDLKRQCRVYVTYHITPDTTS
jgi:hypothetical protein